MQLSRSFLYCGDICSGHLYVMFARGSGMVVWHSPHLAARILSTTYNGQSQKLIILLLLNGFFLLDVLLGTIS